MNEAGGLLRQRRRDLGYTQAELAERMETTQARISKLESGHHRLEVSFVLRAFEVLNLTLSATPAEPDDSDPFYGLYDS